MTDTGQVPGEGLPENAGMVEQPGVPAPGAYAYLSETTAEDEDLLLLPGAQSPWGNEVAPPAPEPVVETVHEPGPHEMAGRDSGSVDLGGVRLPEAPTMPIPPVTPRRPLHLGPPIPDASASPVRSLADRGPAGAPVRQPGPPTVGPEYLDAPQARAASPQGATPWSAQAPGTAQAPVGLEATAAETVVPAVSAVPAQGEHERQAEPVGAAQAVMARIATEAGAAAQGQDDSYAAQNGDIAHHAQAGGPDGATAAHGPESGQVPVGVAAVEGAHDASAGGFAPDAGRPVSAFPAEGAPTAAGSLPDGMPTAPGPLAADGAQADRAEGGLVAPGVHAADAEAGPVAPGFPAAPDAADMPVEGGPVAPGVLAADAGDTGAGGFAVDGAQVAPGVPDAESAHAAAGAVTAEGGPAGHAVPAADGAGEFGADGGPVGPGVPVTDAGHTGEFAAEGEQAVPGSPGAEGTSAVAAGPDPGDAAVAPAAEAGPDGTPAQAVEGIAVPGAGPEAGQAPDAGPLSGAAYAPDAAPAPAGAQFAEGAAPEGAQLTDAPEGAQLTDAAEPVAVPEAQALPEIGQVLDDAAPGTAVPVAPLDAAQVAYADPAQVAVADPAVAADAPDTVVTPEPPEGILPSAPDPTQPPRQTDGPAAPTGDATISTDPSPQPADGEPIAQVHSPLVEAGAAPQPADPAQTPPPVNPEADRSGLPADAEVPVPPAGDDRSIGRFVPVAGTVPTTPHLAPTPPHALMLPPEQAQAPEPAATVPAPREADPEPVQHADDLDTQVADQEEESKAAVEEVRQSTGPAAPAYDDAEREAVLKVMRERRDIRNGFRSDPIPHEVLLRVLEAAHTAPSVGHSQPWDFVVIRSADTRRSMHELAMRQRDAYAKSLPKGRAKQFKELKIEAILDTPVNIVVTADPTRGGRHTLGRHTQPQMAPYSAALAVENLWLAARAEGLGVGWVSFFDEREMVRALGLPEHLEVIAYLCVGYVDEFPDEPELMQAGWSKRRPLSWVVHEETYGRRALPGEEPHDLLAETVSQIRPLDAKALGEAWERQKRMTKPAGALGMLEIISAQLSGLSRQCPPPIPEPAAVAIFAGDHGVHAQGVTPWPQEVTAQMVANFLGGGAVCNAFAGQVGAEVCVVDVGVATDLPATPGLLPRKIRAGTSDMTTGPAMTREEAKLAIEVGIETARDLVAAGNKALLTGEMGIANTTASAALISVFTGADPAEVTGRGTGINDETLARKTEVVRRALELHQPDPADPIGVLAAIGGFEHAAMVGLLLGGASLRTPVILDGVSAGAAALVARAIAPEVLAACIAGHRSAEPGHVAALNKLGLRPLVDLDLRLGEGTGALLALPLVQSTARAMHEVATFDSAGVTEK
ncbi:nicotinate-nucleotide--dimethylbenzimidazole phosphoribosyltransferase [Streptomyces gilvifuscus]|uniref:Nicotinate-nucleotide--dimethylbenzimidazole phosphoribosyltransferase n=1 Tax=Streptomyces gilvifuscus TaxID=1550617 RepID=A0ABT5FUJ3_9ACTN|nr:nicotinate-nucleotide--dimethylbenzimidazole phosphoribosyltransferase [Streptomyces gilvifuscus]MDC2956219.1 nicotinate-nucleotide--dimethylbenzimidazole phosphoribosyltransferase [Streptomyces gilvifuscus]